MDNALAPLLPCRRRGPVRLLPPGVRQVRVGSRQPLAPRDLRVLEGNLSRQVGLPHGRRRRCPEGFASIRDCPYD